MNSNSGSLLRGRLCLLAFLVCAGARSRMRSLQFGMVKGTQRSCRVDVATVQRSSSAGPRRVCATPAGFEGRHASSQGRIEMDRRWLLGVVLVLPTAAAADEVPANGRRMLTVRETAGIRRGSDMASIELPLGRPLRGTDRFQCKSRPVTIAPAGSSQSGRGGNESVRAFGGRVAIRQLGESAGRNVDRVVRVTRPCDTTSYPRRMLSSPSNASLVGLVPHRSPNALTM